MFIVAVLVVIAVIALAVLGIGLRRRGAADAVLSQKDRDSLRASEARNTEARYRSASGQGDQRLG